MTLYCMFLGAYVAYHLGYSLNMLLVLALGTSFVTWKVSLVVVSLVTISGFIIGTG